MPGLSLCPPASLRFPRLFLGAYGAERIAALVSGINRFLGSLGLWVLWLCATAKRRLIDECAEPALMKGWSGMAIAYPVAILVTLGVVFVNTAISFVLCLLVLAAVSILTANG